MEKNYIGNENRQQENIALEQQEDIVNNET